MYFPLNQFITSFEGTPTRWQVTAARDDGNLTYLKLQDTDSAIKAPMIREAIAVCLNWNSYGANRLDPFIIADWREQFKTACQAASQNFGALPEPIDCFEILNVDLPVQMGQIDPFFLYIYPMDYTEAKPFFMYLKKTRDGGPEPTTPERFMGPTINFLGDLVYPLSPLHSSGWVLRQLPLAALRFLKTSQRFCIAEFMSIGRQGPSNHHANRPFLCLQEQFSAPECFQPNGELSPATDVYVVGKTILEFLGVSIDPKMPFPNDITPQLDQIQKKHRTALPDVIVRFLRTSLQIDPKQRFQSLYEGLMMLKGREMPPLRPKTPHSKVGNNQSRSSKPQKPSPQSKRF